MPPPRTAIDAGLSFALPENARTVRGIVDGVKDVLARGRLECRLVALRREDAPRQRGGVRHCERRVVNVCSCKGRRIGYVPRSIVVVVGAQW